VSCSITLHEASEYHERGWSVIPIKAGTKKPACQSWKRYQSERSGKRSIRRWFGDHHDRAIAVILGDVSGGLICRDFDDLASYECWAAVHPELAATLPTVETGRPGRHVYCLCDIEQIRAVQGTDILHLGDGELRGGGYCLLPPSCHPDGRDYRWLVPLNDSLPRLDLVDCGFLFSTACNREHIENGDNRVNGGLQRKTEAMVVAGMEKVDSADLESAVERAISESLPSGPGKRHRQVFDFARALKGIPALADADARSLKPYVQRWHTRALPFISTKAFEESLIDFLKAWPNVKYPTGAEPMAQIIAKAVKSEIPAIAIENGYKLDALCLLISICRELQRATGDGPFFLSCRTAGKYIGTDHTTASRYLFLLEHDGILQVVTKGDQRSRRATRFRYLPDLSD